jgi:hypothetical protein
VNAGHGERRGDLVLGEYCLHEDRNEPIHQSPSIMADLTVTYKKDKKT